jgi:hypothetical protein
MIWRWRASPQSMTLDLLGFVPDHWQGEALDAFPLCPRIAMLRVRTSKVYL